MNQTEEIQSIKWSDRPSGNKYMQKLHPAMFLPDGFKVLTQICLKSTGRRRASEAEKAWVHVIYDENYIIQKLIRDILEPLNPKDYNSFQAIVSKAWKIWKSSKEGDQQDGK